jgi:hypothetical protein
VPQQGGPGETTVDDLGRLLGALQATPHFGNVHLARGTRAYRPPASF